jgi:hypothetical protein
METHRLFAGLVAQFSPGSHSDRIHRDDLELIIDTLRRRQDDLHQSLSHETRSAQLHRLKIDLEVTRLQYHKALAMRHDPQRS